MNLNHTDVNGYAPRITANRADWDEPGRINRLSSFWNDVRRLYGNEMMGPSKHHVSEGGAFAFDPMVTHIHDHKGDLYIGLDRKQTLPSLRLLWAIYSSWECHDGCCDQPIFFYGDDPYADEHVRLFDQDIPALYASSRRGYGWERDFTRLWEDAVRSASDFLRKERDFEGKKLKAEYDRGYRDGVAKRSEKVTEIPSAFTYVEQKLRAALKKYAKIYASKIAKDVTVKWNMLTTSQKEQLAKKLVEDGVCSIELSQQNRPIFISKIHEVAA